MAGVLVDSNVLLDVLIPDPHWEPWSSRVLADAGENHVLVINPIIYSEVSSGFDRIEDLDEALPPDLFRRDPLPWDAAFLAGKSFLEYRRRGGAKRSPLPDLYIGAHAAVAGMALLTRDVARYRTYFPGLQLICPEG